MGLADYKTTKRSKNTMTWSSSGTCDSAQITETISMLRCPPSL